MTRVETVNVKIEMARENALVPVYMSDLAAGADCYAALDTPVVLRPRERVLVPLGFKVAVPPGYELQLRPRSGLSLKKGISLVNTPGTIDADYRGEVGALVINHGNEVVEIKPFERICQAVLAPSVQATFIEVRSLDETTRGEGGFGHTGS